MSASGEDTSSPEVRRLKRRIQVLEAEQDLFRQELDDFLHVASHDLQEPARQMRGFAELLARRSDSGLSPEGTKILAHVIEASSRIERLAADLMSLYSFVSQHSDLGAVDANAAVRDAVSVLESAITDHGAVVSIGQLPTVRANHVLLSRVFQNLIQNALRYVDADVPTISITAEQAEESKWIINVVDNGPGISASNHERIFGIFYRLERAMTAADGSGVGLAAARRIVTRCHGEIWVESVPGCGANFRLRLHGAN